MYKPNIKHFQRSDNTNVISLFLFTGRPIADITHCRCLDEFSQQCVLISQKLNTFLSLKIATTC